MITVSLCLIVKDKEAVLGSLTAYWTLLSKSGKNRSIFTI